MNRRVMSLFRLRMRHACPTLQFVSTEAATRRTLAVVDSPASMYDREVVEVIEYAQDGVHCLISRNGLDREIIVAAVEVVAD